MIKENQNLENWSLVKNRLIYVIIILCMFSITTAMYKTTFSPPSVNYNQDIECNIFNTHSEKLNCMLKQNILLEYHEIKPFVKYGFSLSFISFFLLLYGMLEINKFTRNFERWYMPTAFIINLIPFAYLIGYYMRYRSIL